MSWSRKILNRPKRNGVSTKGQASLTSPQINSNGFPVFTVVFHSIEFTLFILEVINNNLARSQSFCFRKNSEKWLKKVLSLYMRTRGFIFAQQCFLSFLVTKFQKIISQFFFKDHQILSYIGSQKYRRMLDFFPLSYFLITKSG